MISQKTYVFIVVVSLLINVYFLFTNRFVGVKEEYHRSNFLPLPLPREEENVKTDEDPEKDETRVIHCLTEKLLAVVRNVTKEKFSVLDDTWGESSTNRKLSFETVFKNRAWGRNFDEGYKGLSASGPGSTLHWAQDVIGILHKVVNEIKRVKGSSYKVKLLDVPCGDFVWMNRFLTTRDDIDYTGMDIVPDLIKHHNDTYKNKDWKFVLGDVVAMDSLAASADVILCRMMLQHLTHHDAQKVLSLFSKTSSGLLIATTYALAPENTEVRLKSPGRFRELNLEIPPLSLSSPICLSSDGLRDEVTIFIGVWKLPLERVSNCTTPSSFRVKVFDSDLYSCSQLSDL